MEKQKLFSTKDPVTQADICFDLTKITHIHLPSYLSIPPGDKMKNVATIAAGSFALQCSHSMAEKVRSAWWKYNDYEQPQEPNLVIPSSVLSN